MPQNILCQTQKKRSPHTKKYSLSHKAVFIVYEMVLKKFGPRVGPQVSKPFIYALVAEQTFKEPSTVGIIINKMLREGYQVNPEDKDNVLIINVLKGRGKFNCDI